MNNKLNQIIENIKNNDVMVDGIIIEENGITSSHMFTKESLHVLRSATKFVTAMAVGVAIDKKMKFLNGETITLDSKVYPLIKDYCTITNKDNLEKIQKWTIRNLLTHSTGYDSQMFTESHISKLSEKDLKNPLSYLVNYDLKYDCGERYTYNNAEPFIISTIFSEQFKINLSDFVNENIFQKMDIKEYKWENLGKYCIAASGLYLKISDFHKIGSLLLNDGKYNGQQILSKEWVNEMTKAQIVSTEYKPQRLIPKIYGGFFTFISKDGYVFRDGAEGQYSIVNKKYKLLITIMSSEKNMPKVSETLRGVIEVKDE